MTFVISGYHHSGPLNSYIGCIYLNLRVFFPSSSLDIWIQKIILDSHIAV